jgi:hypothetical protein
MAWRFSATREEVEALTQIVSEIAQIQRTLLANYPGLLRLDRTAHQQQIAAGKAVLEIATQLPPQLDGAGLLVAGSKAVGIFRISTGLGCPHLETDPDFLGLMLAFQTKAGERVDFLGINDPTAPTGTVEEFIALLAATAAAAGTEIPFGDAGQLDVGNLTGAQAKLFLTLKDRLGLVRASRIYLHLARQTARTALSSSAVQQYWTGVVEIGRTPGKFTFMPSRNVNSPRPLRPGARHLTEDWERQSQAGDITLTVHWIPFSSERETPLENLTEAWSETQAVPVGTLTFPQGEPGSREARLLSLLATEMGANPGHWVGTRQGEARPEFPATRFTAARQLAYALSQEKRGTLPQQAYQEFFDSGGTIGPALERELVRRLEARQPTAHSI